MRRRWRVYFGMICMLSIVSSLVSVRLMMSTMPCRNAYQWTGKGRWLSLTLRKPKKKAGAGRKKQGLQPPPQRGDESDDEHEVSFSLRMYFYSTCAHRSCLLYLGFQNICHQSNTPSPFNRYHKATYRRRH